jgi:hypothetical protein
MMNVVDVVVIHVVGIWYGRRVEVCIKSDRPCPQCGSVSHL